MMKPSGTYTSLVLGAQVVDPRLLVNPALQSWEALTAAVNEAFPASPPRADGFVICPDLVLDDGYSQRYTSHHFSCCAHASEISFHSCSSASPPSTPGNYYYPSPPQSALTDHDPLWSPITSSSPTLSATRTLMEAPCAAGKPIKQKGGGYSCSVCDRPFKRRDDAKRHIDSAGMRITCKYCGKPSSGRRDGHRRHLDKNKHCLQVWKAGVEAGRFTVRTVEDAYN